MSTKQNISSSKLKLGVLIFFFVLLFAPMIQQRFKFVKEKNLAGVDNASDFPSISITNWLDGTFQSKLEESLDINIGFRKTLVRLQNQIYYSAFNITKAGSDIIGKNNYLYGKSYVFGYTGEDFAGKATIDLQVEKIKVIQDVLSKKNISVIVAFAPGKGSYFPENIPDNYLKNTAKDTTNYFCYTAACKKTGVNMVDLRTYFLSLKDTIKHPLFSQVGVHWSDYAAVLAIDTIVKKIEALKKIKLTDFKITSFEYRDTLKPADKDSEYLLNIFSSLPAYKMAYLKIKYQKDTLAVKPSLLTVADSYFSTIVNTGIVDSVFSDWDYWIYNDYNISNRTAKDYDFEKDILSRDVIILMATDATLCQFPYNFVNEAYEVFAPKDQSYYTLKNKEFRIYFYDFLKHVEKDKKWKRGLKKSAKEKHISEFDEYINNAVWLYDEQEIKNKFFIKK